MLSILAILTALTALAKCEERHLHQISHLFFEIIALETVCLLFCNLPFRRITMETIQTEGCYEALFLLINYVGGREFGGLGYSGFELLPNSRAVRFSKRGR